MNIELDKKIEENIKILKKIQINEYTFDEEDFRKILYIKKRFLITKDQKINLCRWINFIYKYFLTKVLCYFIYENEYHTNK